jgi:hypothetical protein
MVVVLVSGFFLFVGWGRGGIEVCFPVFLGGGREFIEVGEQHGDLPHVLLAEGFVPGGHAGVTDAGADGIEDVPLGVVGCIGDQVWRRRVERHGERGGLAVEASVAQGAVHGVELHAVLKILIGGREGVVDAGSVAFHGGIHCTRGQAMFEVWRLDVGGGGDESEHGEAEAAEDEDEERDDCAEDEFAHGGILADGWAEALVGRVLALVT